MRCGRALEAGWKGMPGWRSNVPESRMAAPQLAIPGDLRFATRKAKRAEQTSVKRQRRYTSVRVDGRGLPKIIARRGPCAKLLAGGGWSDSP